MRVEPDRGWDSSVGWTGPGERVLAIDPGVTTGMAWGRFVPRASSSSEVAGGSAGATAVRAVPLGVSGFVVRDLGMRQFIGDETTTVFEILAVIGETDCDTIVVEDFVLRLPITTLDRVGLTPCRINAQLDLLWALSERNEGPRLTLPRLVRQMPAEMAVITDDRLRSWKLWRTPKQGGGPHAMDALRHLLVYGRKLKT